jgi:hypothetical protein
LKILLNDVRLVNETDNPHLPVRLETNKRLGFMNFPDEVGPDEVGPKRSAVYDRIHLVWPRLAVITP